MIQLGTRRGIMGNELVKSILQQTELNFYNMEISMKTCDRLELILGQFRHFMCHIGILNGITIANTNKYPVVAGLDEWKANKLDGKLFD